MPSAKHTLKKRDALAKENGYDTWDAWVEVLEIEMGAKICGALSGEKKGTPHPCRQFPIKTKERCKFHGGKSLVGADCSWHRGRGYSKDLPTRYAERVAAAMDDPELISMRSEVALLDARLAELFGGMDDGHTLDNWQKVKDQRDALAAALVDDDPERREERLAEVLVALSLLLTEVAGVQKAWAEVYSIVQDRRRLAVAETKREEVLEASMDRRQAMAFVLAIRQVLVEELKDNATRQNVMARIGALLGREKP